MKFSIITSCYNRNETIGDAMESALAQDYNDIEYIVVDGASTDGSVDKIKAFATRCQTEEFKKNHPHFTFKWISEPDHGMYEALNKGIRMATGDVIGVLHSDDWFYDTHTLSTVAEEMKRTGCELLYANGLYVDANRHEKIIRNWIGGSFARWKIKAGWLPLHTACYIRRDTMLRLGLYDEQYKIASDTDLLLRYLYEGMVTPAYLNKYVVRMRMGGLSTDSKKRKAMWKEDVKIYKSHGFWAIPSKLMKMAWKIPQFIRR